MPAEVPARTPVETVRLQYVAAATGDMDLWRQVVAPDVEWTESAGFRPAGTYRTPETAIEATMAGVLDQPTAEWDDWTTHDDTYVVDGERVVVLARCTARNKATGKEMVARVAHSFIVRDGQIVHMEQIVDSGAVRAAMD
jgi:ketosteroid isomerase-like protein